MSPIDAYYMRKCFALARRALGVTSPNPPVGALLVQDGSIIGSGWHEAAGQPHAEVVAIQSAEVPIRDATLYVSLEPCNHQGRTPPCVEAILKSSISRVVYSVDDPNSDVEGGGDARLRQEGVEVLAGVLKEEGEELLYPWLFSCNAKMPHITLLASTDAIGTSMSIEDLISADRIFAKRFERFLPYFDEVIWDLPEGIKFESDPKSIDAFLAELRASDILHLAVFADTAPGIHLLEQGRFQRLVLCRASQVIRGECLFPLGEQRALELKRTRCFGKTSVSVYTKPHV